MLDIVMPSHNHCELTVRAVQAIQKHTDVPWRLIILDDSQDVISNLYLGELARQDKRVVLMHTTTPYKSVRDLYIEAFKVTEGDIIANCNNSAFVEPAWAGQALALIENNPKMAIVSLKALYSNGLIEQAGITWNTEAQQLMDYGRNEAGHRYSHIRTVEMAGWNVGLIRKSAFPNGLIPCDEYAPWGGFEDCESCMDARERGYLIIFCGLGACYHEAQSTRRENADYSERWEHNRQLFIKRWHDKILAERKPKEAVVA